MIGFNQIIVGDEREAALAEMERALALIEVSLGAPTGWRLRQLVEAIECYGLGQYDFAYAQAHRAQMPLAQIAPAERDMACVVSLGAIRHELRKLRDTRTMPLSRAALAA